MKYYIPTSTSNFNCLLADESISPCGFYEKRDYGYRTFVKVPLNRSETLLPLFDSCPIFELPDDVPGFPLVLKIDSASIDKSELRQEEHEGEIISYIDKTIYFNPFDIQFIFRNQKEMIETKNAALRSIETKLLSCYNCNKAFTTSSNETTNAMFDNPEKIANNDQKEIDQDLLRRDSRKNRLKGALWGYVIGGNLSRKEKSYAELRKLLEKMRDSLSAQIGGTIPADENSTSSLQGDINRILEKEQEPVIKEFFRPWGEEKRGAAFEAYASCPPEHPEYKSAITKMAGAYQLGSFAGTSIADVNSYIDKAIKEIDLKIYPPNLVDVSKIPSVSNEQRINVTADKDRLAAFILNQTLANFPHLFVDDKPSYIIEIAKRLEKPCSEHWPTVEQFLKMLYESLIGTSSLKLDEAPNDVMRSFALFCKKGNRDSLEDLENTFFSNGILELSFAYALWGAVYGYSAMPKTVIDTAVNSYGHEYSKEVIQRIYREIASNPLCGAKQDSWIERADQLQDYYKMAFAEFDEKSSRLAKRNNLEKFSFENILKKCASLDDFEKEVNATWKKSGNGKRIRAGLQETIANMRKCDDTQR